MFHGLNSWCGRARKQPRQAAETLLTSYSMMRMDVFTGLAGTFLIIGTTRTKRKKGVRISLRNVHKLLRRKDFLTAALCDLDVLPPTEMSSILSKTRLVAEQDVSIVERSPATTPPRPSPTSDPVLSVTMNLSRLAFTPPRFRS